MFTSPLQGLCPNSRDAAWSGRATPRSRSRPPTGRASSSACAPCRATPMTAEPCARRSSRRRGMRVCATFAVSAAPATSLAPGRTMDRGKAGVSIRAPRRPGAPSTRPACARRARVRERRSRARERASDMSEARRYSPANEERIAPVRSPDAAARPRGGRGACHCEGAMIRALAARAAFMTWKTAVLSTKAPSQP